MNSLCNLWGVVWSFCSPHSGGSVHLCWSSASDHPLLLLLSRNEGVLLWIKPKTHKTLWRMKPCTKCFKLIVDLSWVWIVCNFLLNQKKKFLMVWDVCQQLLFSDISKQQIENTSDSETRTVCGDCFLYTIQRNMLCCVFNPTKKMILFTGWV